MQVKGVEEMMAGAELVKLASKQPEVVQKNIKVWMLLPIFFFSYFLFERNCWIRVQQSQKS